MQKQQRTQKKNKIQTNKPKAMRPFKIHTHYKYTWFLSLRKTQTRKILTTIKLEEELCIVNEAQVSAHARE